MEKDSMGPAGRKQPQELGSESNTGSPVHGWRLGPGAKALPALSTVWTGALGDEESANIRSC